MNPIQLYTWGAKNLAFVTTWNTETLSSGSSTNKTITLPTILTGTYDASIDWGDSKPPKPITSSTWNTANTNLYDNAATPTIKIKGVFRGWRFQSAGDRNKITNIASWGPFRLATATISSHNAFNGCQFLTASTIPDVLNLKGVTNLSAMFGDATVTNAVLTSVGRLPDWKFEPDTNLTSFFQKCTAFNQNLNNLDVINVTNMFSMFEGCTVYDQPMNLWKTDNVKSVNGIFASCVNLNQDLSLWKLGNVTDFSNMFSSAQKFNNGLLPAGTPGILNWDTHSATAMGFMFNNADAFNQELAPAAGGIWDVSKNLVFASMFASANTFNNGNSPSINNWVFNTIGTNNINLANMFNGAAVFDQPIGNWNTSRVTNINGMFTNAAAFNRNLDNFTTAPLTGLMNGVFAGAIKFNNGHLTDEGGIFKLTTTNVTSFSTLFNGARAFNQFVGDWDTAKVTTFGAMFQNTDVFNNGQITAGVGTAPLVYDTHVATSTSIMFNGALVFNQALIPSGNIWNTILVSNMSSMFASAAKFNNGMLPGETAVTPWTLNTVAVQNMQNVFQSAASFNQNITQWDFSVVNNTSNMFNGATLFNQPIATDGLKWNMSKVTAMTAMFNNAIAFDQNIGNWNVALCGNFVNFMLGKSSANFKAANLDAIYNGWTVRLLKTSPAVTANFGTIKYTASGVAGRLLLTRGWADRLVFSVAQGSSNGLGGFVFRITATAIPTNDLATGNKTIVYGSNLPSMNGLWTITVINQTTFELNGSTYIPGYVSESGTHRTGHGWTVTDGGINITDFLVANYSLNGVFTNDVAGQAPNGATSGAVTFQTGKTGQAGTFNGQTYYVDIADSDHLTFTDGVNDVPFSMNMWVRFVSPFSATGNWLFNKRGQLDTDREWQLVYQAGAINALSFQKFNKTDSTNNRQSFLSTTTPFAFNTWYMITITDDGLGVTNGALASMKLYINGVPNAITDSSTGTYTGMLPTGGPSNTRIGQTAYATLNGTNHLGALEDISVWKGRVLTQDEVTHLYNNSLGKAYPFT